MSVFNQIAKAKEIKSEIKKLTPEVKQSLILSLLKDKIISFKDISEAYVKALENENDDKLMLLMESESCILEHMINAQYRTKKDEKEKTYQRSLYFLNKSNRFNMEEINKHFDYDENKAKEFSCYERAKKIKEENDWFND